MRDKQRAAVDVLATLAPLFVEVMGEVVHKLELLVQALVAMLPGWQQHAGNTDFVEIGLQVAPVAVGHFKAQTTDYRLGLQP